MLVPAIIFSFLIGLFVGVTTVDYIRDRIASYGDKKREQLEVEYVQRMNEMKEWREKNTESMETKLAHEIIKRYGPKGKTNIIHVNFK